MWRPELTPDAVILDEAKDGVGEPLDPGTLGSILADGCAGDGRHMVINDRGGVHRLWIRVPAPMRPLAIVIPLASDIALRLAGAERFARRWRGLSTGPPPPALRLTLFQRRRLTLLLNVLDGHLAGAGRREIAAAVVYPRMTPLHGAAWKGSAERRRTQRLVTEAVALMSGGYRNLLQGH